MSLALSKTPEQAGSLTLNFSKVGPSLSVGTHIKVSTICDTIFQANPNENRDASNQFFRDDHLADLFLDPGSRISLGTEPISCDFAIGKITGGRWVIILLRHKKGQGAEMMFPFLRDRGEDQLLPCPYLLDSVSWNLSLSFSYLQWKCDRYEKETKEYWPWPILNSGQSAFLRIAELLTPSEINPLSGLLRSAGPTKTLAEQTKELLVKTGWEMLITPR